MIYYIIIVIMVLVLSMTLVSLSVLNDAIEEQNTAKALSAIFSISLCIIILTLGLVSIHLIQG